MPQEPSLFMGTIKQNIARFADTLESDSFAVDEAAVAAAHLAGAHQLILALPNGYDHLLAIGGRGLSVGQAQRVSLARALFRNPKYLILDEPNSNLDADGDRQLIETLGQLKKRGLTILIVAHRLSMLPIVDKILLMQNGTIGMYGSREEVLRQIAPSSHSPRIVAGKEVKA
jgi:ATP-binding cassette subfamily C protein